MCVDWRKEQALTVKVFGSDMTVAQPHRLKQQCQVPIALATARVQSVSQTSDELKLE